MKRAVTAVAKGLIWLSGWLSDHERYAWFMFVFFVSFQAYIPNGLARNIALIVVCAIGFQTCRMSGLKAGVDIAAEQIDEKLVETFRQQQVEQGVTYRARHQKRIEKAPWN